MAVTPECSAHTSIKEQIEPAFDVEAAVASQVDEGSMQRFDVPLRPLLLFNDQSSCGSGYVLPFAFLEYLELVDATGRVARRDKRGTIASTHPPILQRLGIEGLTWIEQATRFEHQFRRRQNLGRSHAA